MIIGNIANNAALVFNRSDAVVYSGVVSGTGSLTQSGTGTLTLSGLNTYTGVTRATAGTLALAGDNRLSASTTLYLTGGNLDLGGHAQTLAGLGSSSSGLAGNITAGALTTAGDSYLTSGTYANTLAGTGRLYIGGSASTVALNGTNDSVSTDHNQVIIGSSTTGTGGVVKLGNANALAAATENVHLWAGVLNLNGQANVRANSIIIETGDTSALVNLATATTASFAGDVTLVNGKAQIGGSGNIVLSGVLSGAGGFTKTSAGTLTLSGLNTYTGNTEILAGALAISGTLASGDYHGTIANSGALTFSAPSADQILAGVVSGSGSLTKSGTGTLTLSAANRRFTRAMPIHMPKRGSKMALGNALPAFRYGVQRLPVRDVVLCFSTQQPLASLGKGGGVPKM
jgi:fibronectin-binding autotransporter adhesin